MSSINVDLGDVHKALALCKDMPGIQNALKFILPQSVNLEDGSVSGVGGGGGGYSAGSGKLF